MYGLGRAFKFCTLNDGFTYYVMDILWTLQAFPRPSLLKVLLILEEFMALSKSKLSFCHIITGENDHIISRVYILSKHIPLEYWFTQLHSTQLNLYKKSSEVVLLFLL